MENASKALLMAGGVLIAVLIIAILVRTYGTVSLFQKQKLTEEESRQIAEFNEQYLKYLNQYMYGTEVITIVNKNDQLNDNVKVKITFAQNFTYEDENGNKKTIEPNSTIEINNTNKNIITNSTEIKNKAFKCTAIGYDNSTGRINSITINEKKWEDV